MDDFLKGLFGDAYNGIEDTLGVCSYSGFVRETAVKALVSRPQRGTLPILLVRLNDWVPQVRLAAEAAVRSLMRTEFLPDWMASIDAVVALGRARRQNHAAMLKEIALFLSRSEHLPQVVKAAKTAGLHGRRYVFELTWQAEQEEAQRVILLEKALTGKDVVLAAMALARMETMASPAVRRRLYEAAAVSPFGRARYVAVRWLVTHPDEATSDVIHRVCLDPVSSVRWWCLHWLRSKDDLGPAVARAVAHAGDAQKSSRRRSAAMHFLREAEPATALQASEPWLASEWPQLRRDALAIRLALAEPQDRERWLQQAYADPALKVQRLLLDGDSRRVWGPTVEQLLAAFEVNPTPERLEKFLVLSGLHDGWSRLYGLLRTWKPCFGTEMESALMTALKSWIGRSHSLRYCPDAPQSQRLAQCWSTVRHQVPERWRASMDARLHAFGIE